MPVIDRFEAALTRTASPHGYAIEGDWPRARELLSAHGVAFRVLSAPASATLREFLVDSVVASGRPFQGHREMAVLGQWREATRTLAPGTLVVDAGTRQDLVALLLLDPESDDGLLTWNVFDAGLAKGKVTPVVRLTAPIR
jgi:hypothetical protein